MRLAFLVSLTLFIWKVLGDSPSTSLSNRCSRVGQLICLTSQTFAICQNDNYGQLSPGKTQYCPSGFVCQQIGWTSTCNFQTLASTPIPSFFTPRYPPLPWHYSSPIYPDPTPVYPTPKPEYPTPEYPTPTPEHPTPAYTTPTPAYPTPTPAYPTPTPSYTTPTSEYPTHTPTEPTSTHTTPTTTPPHPTNPTPPTPTTTTTPPSH
eukprot:TRINITY_DN15141_c0_g1_i1.p1 TRINITY_DN15141_c0_g1~~TRINITY_DN15141_c0_g1_i1.p1  ORF type:complete len:206 (-),score=46.77 TRINITY_DN15141_c0_g1_i1:34-651(-)